MEKDLMLMCRNACTFNEPGSKIYKDSKALKKLIASKKYEIESGRHHVSTPGKTSERIRNRKLRSGVSHSAIAAALQYEEDDEDDEEEKEEADQEGESDESVDGKLLIKNGI
jgi:protein polybromo-1